MKIPIPIYQSGWKTAVYKPHNSLVKTSRKQFKQQQYFLHYLVVLYKMQQELQMLILILSKDIYAITECRPIIGMLFSDIPMLKTTLIKLLEKFKVINKSKVIKKSHNNYNLSLSYKITKPNYIIIFSCILNKEGNLFLFGAHNIE
jgi:hypothetical protein